MWIVLQLHNETPFTAALLVLPDQKGLDTLLVTVQAVLSWGPSGLRVADGQRPVPLTDDYWGEPGFSSIRYGGEVRLPPPGTDVVLIGEAHTPGLRPATSCDVLMVAGSVRREMRILGDRHWKRGVTGLHASRAQPFTTMPLRYEHAVGGPEEPRNPIGCGLRGGRSDAELDGTPLPNLEDPDDLLGSPDQRPAPVGFGCISPAWMPRCARAGTYDIEWQRTRAPYLPDDFDPRFLHAAAAGLASDVPLRGGEPVKLQHLSPRGVDEFTLPLCPVVVAIHMLGSAHRPPAQLVTVLFEPSRAHVTLVWQTALECDGRALSVDDVQVGLVSRPNLGGL